ncbi:MAG: PIN domain-containing protein [Acidobacteria bacterium]|nr:MAG: PIN domain-containing protein [Acidobacteriota bacterium]REK09628.1 MAG: PIN domain-containing protein [Acidobacteriota bacterium]
MKTVVLDTSVTVAWYLPESFASNARHWQTALLDGEVRGIVPRLHYAELANVLRTHVKRRALAPELAEEIWRLHLDAPLETLEPTRGNLLATALEYQATAYDAVFISLALELDASLVTAERSTTPWVVRLAECVEAVR